MPDALFGGLVINEILADPNGTANFDTDGNLTADALDEYIELLNTSAVALDISGVQLWDAGVGNWFTFPPGTVLEPGGHALVIAGVQAGGSLPTGGPDDLFFDAGRSTPFINNGGDNIVVYDPGADEYISAVFNGDSFDDPTATYGGFSATATQIGSGEDFGNDIDGFSIQRQFAGDTFVNNQTPTPGTSNVCFALGTKISTPQGPVPVETLTAGDPVLTLDDGPRPVIWLHAFRRAYQDILRDPRQGAVRIARGALGDGLPHETLVVSRQHRVLVGSRIAERMFGTAEVLVRAKDLIGARGITAAPLHSDVLLFHLLLDRHAVVFANGAATESLYLGKEAVRALAPSARALIPDLAAVQKQHNTSGPARQMVPGARARRMLSRHLANSRPFCAALVPAA